MILSSDYVRTIALMAATLDAGDMVAVAVRREEYRERTSDADLVQRAIEIHEEATRQVMERAAAAVV